MYVPRCGHRRRSYGLGVTHYGKQAQPDVFLPPILTETLRLLCAPSGMCSRGRREDTTTGTDGDPRTSLMWRHRRGPGRDHAVRTAGGQQRERNGEDVELRGWDFSPSRVSRHCRFSVPGVFLYLRIHNIILLRFHLPPGFRENGCLD